MYAAATRHTAGSGWCSHFRLNLSHNGLSIVSVLKGLNFGSSLTAMHYIFEILCAGTVAVLVTGRTAGQRRLHQDARPLADCIVPFQVHFSLTRVLLCVLIDISLKVVPKFFSWRYYSDMSVLMHVLGDVPYSLQCENRWIVLWLGNSYRT